MRSTAKTAALLLVCAAAGGIVTPAEAQTNYRYLAPAADFATTSATWVAVTGCSLTFRPGAPSENWVVIATGQVRSSSIADPQAAHVRMRVNSTVEAEGGVQNDPANAETGFFMMDRITGTTALQTIDVQAQDPFANLSTTTVEQCSITAFPVPSTADFRWTEVAGASGNCLDTPDTTILTHQFTPGSAGDYLFLVSFVSYEFPGGSNNKAWLTYPSGAEAPDFNVENAWSIDRDARQSYVSMRKETLAASQQTLTITCDGSVTGGSTIQWAKVASFRTDAFAASYHDEDLTELTNVTSATWTTRSTVTQAAPPTSSEFLVLGTIAGCTNVATSGPQHGMQFREDSAVQGDSVWGITRDCSFAAGFHNSFQWVEPYTTSSAKTWDNQYQSTNGVAEARFAESAIHVLRFRTAPSLSAFSWRKSVTIDRTKVPSSCSNTLANFPLLYSVTDLDLRGTGSGGDVFDPEGDDIIFVARDDATCGGTDGSAPCVLSHEIESYNSTTGQLLAWVNIPSLNTGASSANTVIYVYYGSSVTNSSTQNVAGVWNANYAGVWHLKEATGTTNADSTANANNGTKLSAAEPAATSGKIGGAQDFDGVNDYVNLGSGSSLNVPYLTLEFWLNVNSWVSDGGILAKGDNSYRQYWVWTYGGAVSFTIDQGTTVNSAWTPPAGQWQHLALTYDGSNVRTYRNGAVENTYPQATGPINAQAPALLFGNIPSFNYADVALDEVRISNTASSSCWIAAQYNNQTAPGDIGAPNFYTVGSEVAPAAGTFGITDNIAKIVSAQSAATVTSSSFNVNANDLILVFVNSDTASDVDLTVTLSDNQTPDLTWTLIADRDGAEGTATGGFTGAWWAQPSSAITGLTVTATRSATANKFAIKVYIVSGHDTARPIGATWEGESTTNNWSPTTYTSTVNNSRAFAAASDWNALGLPSSTDTEDAGDDPGLLSWLTLYKASNTTPSGTAVTVNFDAAGTLAPDWTAIAFEVRPGADPTTPSSFGFRNAITIDRTKVPSSCGSTMANFPMLYNVTDSDLKSTGNGGDVTDPQGDDILFRALDDATCGGAGLAPCTLDHEIETYNGATGQVVAWVRVPSMNTASASSNTAIYAYYGNAAITKSIQNADGVWDVNYVGVWHFRETTGSISDSSGSGNVANNQGSATQGAAAKIAYGVSLDGTDDYFSTTNSFVNPQNLTVEAWFRTGTASGKRFVGFEDAQTGTAASSWDRHLYVGTDGYVRFGSYDGTTDVATSTNTLTDNQWHHAVGTQDEPGDSIKLYIDGSLHSTAANQFAENFAGWWRVGSYKTTGWPSGVDGYFPGSVDEVRISNTVRPACWIGAEFNNTNAPGDVGAPNFYTVGDEDVGTPGAAATVGTTTSAAGIWSGSQRYIHHANGYYWAVFYNGTDPYVYSSPNGTTWTSQGRVNVDTAEAGVEKAADVSARFAGTTMIVAYSDESSTGGGSYNQLFYRYGTLNADGTVTWWPAASDHLAVSNDGGKDEFVHAAFDSQNQPWIGGADPGNERWEGVGGSALTSPTWTTRDPGSWTGGTGGADQPTVMHPIADAGDMYGLTNVSWGSSNRFIIGNAWDASAGVWNGYVTVANNDLWECEGGANCEHVWAAVKISNGELHLVYITNAGNLKHKKGTNAMPPVWSDVNTNITGLTTHRKLTLAADGNNLYLFYDKNDNRIYFRKYNGSAWSSESSFKSDTTAIQGAFSSFESTQNNEVCLIWAQGSGSPYNITFSCLSIGALTAVELISFSATRYDRGVLAEWRTGYEIDNLGFHVYREIDGHKTRVNRSLIAGSGLMAGQGAAVTAEHRYAAWDLDPAAASESVRYWLEDLDFDGTSTWHGPIAPVAGGFLVPDVPISMALRDLGRRGKSRKVLITHGEAHKGEPARRTLGRAGTGQQTPAEVQWALAEQPAVKIGVEGGGWYRVGQADLVAAGLNPRVDPRLLRLFVEGVEQAILVRGEADGRLDPGDAIEFYGVGADTPYTDTRAYWLVADGRPGRRIAVHSPAARGAPATNAPSFVFTLQQKERSIYFAALRNGDEENWFGSLVYEEPTDILFSLSNVSAATGGAAELDVTLQGVTNNPDVDPDHLVAILVNGREVGELRFDGQAKGAQTFAIPVGVLGEGPNTVTLVARGGEADYSLVDVLRLRYQHAYRADADRLRFTTDGPGTVTVGGFASRAIRVVDVTDPLAVDELRGTVGPDGGLWAVTVRVPASGPRTLLAFTDATASVPAFLRANRPSRWHAATQAADYVAVSHADFASAVAPLVARRQQQGLLAVVVDIEDVYDEFSFGEKTPAALRHFVRHARATWRRAPRFLLLVGDATIDPRDYAGIGDADFVPTKQIALAQVALETASDDWFADADDDGLTELAVGRLSVRTAEQAHHMVSKILAYEEGGDAIWTKDVLLVADQNDESNNFERTSDRLRGLVPAGYQVRRVYSGASGVGAARLELTDAVNQGQLIVNYTGHGSVRVWGGGGLLTGEDVTERWQNGSRLPLVVAMNCLNGFFHGIWDEESLAETLLRTSGGGAVAAWASSGLTESGMQARVNEELFRLMFAQLQLTVGEAVAAAKRAVPDRDVRRTWIFFGDPAMRLIGLPQETSTVTAAIVVTSTTQSGASGSSGARSSQAQDAATPAIADSDRPTPFVRLADYNGDGRDDIFRYAAETGAWSILLSGGDAAANPWGYWPPQLQLFAANLNRDRLADMLLHNDETGEWLSALNTGDGSFRLGPSAWTPRGRVRIGELNGDGNDDVFVIDAETDVGFQCLTTAKNALACRAGDAVAPGSVLVSDFTGDGLADVFTYEASTGHWTLGVNNGAGTFGYVSGDWAPGSMVRAANLDGDRRPDVVLIDPVSGAWVEAVSGRPGEFTYRRGQGPVLSGVEGPAGGDVRLLDVDGDGRDDLLHYNSKTGGWTIGLNVSPGEFSYSSGVWAPGLTLAWGDVNGDGRADLILHDPATGRWGSLVSRRPSGVTAQSSAWSIGWAMEGWRP